MQGENPAKIPRLEDGGWCVQESDAQTAAETRIKKGLKCQSVVPGRKTAKNAVLLTLIRVQTLK